MTKVIAENREDWMLKKIRSRVDVETALLKKQLANVREKVTEFEKRYGRLDRDSLYGKMDDMELLEWEGEIETMHRLQGDLSHLNRIVFEYKQ